MRSVPDERAVWIHQYLRISSSQNLVDIDVDMDIGGTTLCKGSCVDGVSGADCRMRSRKRKGAAAAAAAHAAVVAVIPEEAGTTTAVAAAEAAAEAAAATQRHSGSKYRGTLASPTTRDGARKPRTDRMLDLRTRNKAAPGSNKTRRKVRVKAFEIRIEEYKEECRHVSCETFSGPLVPRPPLSTIMNSCKQYEMVCPA